MLKHRLIFGPIMIAALLGIFYYDHHAQNATWALSFGQAVGYSIGLPPGAVLYGLFALVILIGAGEIRNILRAKGIDVSSGLVGLAGLMGLSLMYLLPMFPWGEDNMTAHVIGSAAAVVFLVALVTHCIPRKSADGAIGVGSGAMMCFVYIGILPGFWLMLRQEYAGAVVVSLILVTKSCDIGAYFTGRLIGKHKLIPWLSPGKTWEGLAGGVVLSGLVAAGLAWASNHWKADISLIAQADGYDFVSLHIEPWMALVVGAVIGLLGQFGDLVASAFKRDAQVKDSGSSIPGFGGILDVIDSPLVVAPFAYWFMQLLEIASMHWVLTASG